MSIATMMQKVTKRNVKTKQVPRRDTVGYTLRLVNHYLIGQRYLFGLALLMLVAEAATAVFEAYPLAYLIDFLKGDRVDLLTYFGLPTLVSGATATLISTVAALTLAIILMAAINSLGDSLAEIYLAKGGRMLGYNLRSAMYTHLQRLSLNYHDKRRTGDVLTRVTGDVGELEDFVMGSLSDIVGSVLVLIGTLIFLVYHSWQVALVGIVIVPIMAVISNWFSVRIKALSKKQRAREGDLASVTQEMLTSIRVIQSFGGGNHELEQFSEYNQKNVDAALDAAGLQARFSWVVKVMEAIAISVVVWLGLWLITNETITVGMLLMFIVLIQNMFKPTRKIIKEWNTFGKVFASVERIGELLDREPTVTDAPHARPAPPFQGHIAFERVSFTYQSDADPEENKEGEDEDGANGNDWQERQALRQIDFRVTPGEVLAVVGHTGAGKSTILQLLPRLYDPNAGRITIDGHDLRDLTIDSLRAQMSMVLQETILFNSTVAENIAYGRSNATPEEIRNAAIQANAHEFIEKLPDGYKTVLGERGANLSGGQRQRIAIARAFIRNTPILILDEPTTGLDTAAADVVLTALRTLMQGKTTIIVSHDFKLVRQADRIVVIQEGEIVQNGTHAELLATPGIYADLYTRQFSEAEVYTEAATPLDADTSAEAATPVSMEPVDEVAMTFDLAQNPSLRQQLPGLDQAFDGATMQARLQWALLGGEQNPYKITACKPGKAVFLNGAGCTLRYDVTLTAASGDVNTALVLAHIFPTAAAAGLYFTEQLIPLAAQMQERPEVAPFTTPIAFLADLQMAVHLFPIDGYLPTLVDATDCEQIRPLLQSALTTSDHGDFQVEQCQVTLGHYGRQHRCVLRYDLTGHWAATAQPAQAQVYGKVAHDGRGKVVDQALHIFHQQRRETPDGLPFNVPRSLGYFPEQQLILLEAVPGRPQISRLLKDALRNGNAALADEQTDELTLDSAIEMTAHIVAHLHRSEIQLGRARTLQDEVAELQEKCRVVRQLVPTLADRMETYIAQLEPYLAQQPLPSCFSHGDFTHTQIVFDHSRAGLLDFDTLCQAEPALDLGHFQAYLRLAVTKVGSTDDDAAAHLVTHCCTRLVKTYCQQVNLPATTTAALHNRIQIYEIVSLLRIALHSWQKFKPARLIHALALLDERIPHLPLLFGTPSNVDPDVAALADWRYHSPEPWLKRVVDPAQVSTALVNYVPEFAQGRLQLAECQVKRLRLRDEQGYWTGTYLLDVADNQGRVQTIPVQGKLHPPSLAESMSHISANGHSHPFGTPDWHCTLPELRLTLTIQPPEDKLTSLDQLTDPIAARTLLEESIRRGSPVYRDLQISACRPQIMRYKPGSRCTILYHLDYPDGMEAAQQWPSIVVAKTYRGEKGYNAYHAMWTLWHSGLGRSETVTIAEPLAFLPVENILIQGPIRQQQTLKELLRSVIFADTTSDVISPHAQLEEYLRKSAVGLAELHQCGVTYGDVVTWEEEVADVLDQRARLSVPLPAFADVATPLLARLQELATAYPADPVLPAHRSFRPAQVLLHDGDIGFIDFDGFCQAEPAMDVALFMTTIKNICLNRSNKYVDNLPDDEDDDEEGDSVDTAVRERRMAEAERLCDLFLSTYTAHARVSPQRVVLWETLDLLSLIFGSWLKLKFARLDNCMFMLERHLSSHRALFFDKDAPGEDRVREDATPQHTTAETVVEDHQPNEAYVKEQH